MATATTTLAADSSSDANFRAWGSWISGRFAAFGWTQTADTGQINWSTVLKPPGASTFQGYEMWKPGDALNAFYVKIEYGSGGGFSRPAIRISLGRSTNGAGTLTGTILGPFTWLLFNADINPSNCFASGTASRIWFEMWTDGADQKLFIAIERSKSNAGADTGDVALLFGMQGTTGIVQQCLPLPSGGAGLANFPMAMGTLTTAITTTLSGTVITLMPWLFIASGPLNPPIGFANILVNDAPTRGTTFSASWYGSTHTFISFANNHSVGTQNCVCALYE